MTDTNDMDFALRRLVRSGLIAFPFFFLFIFAVLQQRAEPSNSAWPVIGFFAAFIIAILMAWPIAIVIATFIASTVIDAILSTGGKLGPPPPFYKTADWLVERGRYDEAVTEYERIIYYHPQELRAHLALLKIWQDYSPDTYNERAVFRRAKRCIKKRADRKTLEEYAPRRL